MEKTLASELQRSLLTEVIQQMPAAVIISAADGRLLLGNTEAQRVWGHPMLKTDGVPQFVEWRGFRDDGTPLSAEEWPLARSVMTGEVVKGEDIRIQRGDGTMAVVRVSSAPIYDEHGTLRAGVVTFFDVTDERREQDALSFLAEASATAGASLMHDETLRRIARLAIPRFTDLALVFVLDDAGSIRRHEAAADDPALEEKFNDIWRNYPGEMEGLRAVLETGEPLLVPTVTDDQWDFIKDEAQREKVIALGIRSAIAVPMQSAGQVFGALCFALTTADQEYDTFDLFIATEIGRRAGAAIERSRLFEAEHEQRVRAERAAEQLQHLQALTADLSAALTIDQAVDAVIREATTITGASVAVLGLVEGDYLGVVGSAGIAADVLEKFRMIPLSSTLPLTEAVHGKEPIWLGNPEEAVRRSPILREIRPYTGSRAWAALPLLVRDEAVGAIGLSFSQEQQFGPEERHFLMSIAGQCALAFERARLFESERHAREEAEHASRAKDEFLAILSHELRTPMTTVIGWADFIKMTQENNEALAAPLDALRNSARAQARLVDDLLDVSRIVTGKLRIERRSMDLDDAVRRAIESVVVAAKSKELTIDVGTPQEPVLVYGDADRLQQVFINLLGNAIKFTPSGGRITVRLTDRGATKEVVVEDTGEGIEPSFLPHVFDRFRQASSGDSRRHSGLGLGLSIVQHLVQMHGGSVKAESEGLGKGARFTVVLPSRGA